MMSLEAILALLFVVFAFPIAAAVAPIIDNLIGRRR